ncbi:MAG: response regulator [Candidatus Omnitrophica bacterium]|nr:response regulator [Candidatus Omnitrophota bacterium]
MVIASEIGQFLRRARADLKQENVAQMVGCTTSYINRLETGKTIPSPQMAMKLERALQLKQGELLHKVLQAKLQKRSARVLQEFRDMGIEVPIERPAAGAEEALWAILRKLGFTPDDLNKLSEDDWETVRSVVAPLIQKLLERKAKVGNTAPVEKGRTVFIVEDEIKICHLLAGVLRDRGFQVDYAFNGKSALGLLLKRGDKPDLILLDLHMPLMGGLEFLRKLRKINTHSKVIVVTAHAQDIVDLHAMDLSIEGYFEKPFDVQELLKKVEELFK